MSLRANIEAIFDRHHWPYQVERGGRVIVTEFNGLPTFLWIDEASAVIMLVIPVLPPHRSKMKRMSESWVRDYVDAVNFRHLVLDRFVRDSRDGEIRYELPITAHGGILTDDQLVRAIRHAISVVETYGPTILRLFVRRITLRQALEELEEAA